MSKIRSIRKWFTAYLHLLTNNFIKPRREFTQAIILTKNHTKPFAHAIKSQLEEIGLPARVDTKFIASEKGTLYLVICPQAWKALPLSRISFQMEQYGASHFFTPLHILLLKGSLFTFDFSRINIEEISRKHYFYKSTSFITVSSPANGDTKPNHRDFDLVFYGSMNQRRRKILDCLKGEFKILEISGDYGSALHQRLLSAKACLNIHHYDSALLEAPRVMECISIGLPVISEPSLGMTDYQFLEGVVRYCEMTPERIREALESPPTTTDFIHAMDICNMKLRAQLLTSLSAITHKDVVQQSK